MRDGLLVTLVSLLLLVVVGALANSNDECRYVEHNVKICGN